MTRVAALELKNFLAGRGVAAALALIFIAGLVAIEHGRRTIAGQQAILAASPQLESEHHAKLLRLHAASPHTVVFVTHNVTEAAYLADRVVVLSPRPGRIVADIAVDIPYPRDYDSVDVANAARSIVRHLELG